MKNPSLQRIKRRYAKPVQKNGTKVKTKLNRKTKQQKNNSQGWRKMKCPNCNRDLKKDFLRVYKLGLLDGSNRNIIRLNLIEKTVGNLFKELRRQDRVNPDSVNSVILSRQYCERLAKLFRKHKLSHKAREIEKIIKAQLGETLSAEAKLRQLLAEIDDSDER
jgi:ribosomal protein L44E